MHEIEVVVDVRSSPYTRYATHFNKEPLQQALENAGVKYIYMGKQLGGMPKDESLYDDDGHLRYAVVASGEPFKQAIQRLINGVEKYKIALMCGEENPTNCHRRKLLAPALAEFNVHCLHVRGDGRLQTESDLIAAAATAAEDAPVQLRLF